MMLSIEETLIVKASVTPHWLSGGNAFWYLKHDGNGTFAFTFVNLLKQIPIPAFNHEALASELQRRTGLNIDPFRLPFFWIEIQSDASYVKFQFLGKIWQYGPDEALTEVEKIDGEIDHLDGITPSPRTSKSVSVKFANHTSSPLLLYWVDYDKTPVFYAILSVDVSRKQETYTGHVWLIIDEASGEIKKHT
jgi:dipeptidyl-peptidase 4